MKEEFLKLINEEQTFVHFVSNIHWMFYISLFLIVFLIVVAIRDIRNKHQTIRHNFPVVGNLRYLLESIGPELRQYIVANNRDELPFSRSERTWVYASSKKQNNYAGFGSDKDFTDPGHIFINPEMFAYRVKSDHINHKNNDPYFCPSAKVMGEYHNRKRPYRPYSVINISAMSYGSLSATAQESLNRGALKAGCFHNTGEGSLSKHHAHGADVMLQIGTAYFGCRDDEGNFSVAKLVALCEKNPFIRSIEIKLSQGAKPGKGGVLPAAKITDEIAEIRGIPMGKDVISPAYHSVFSNIDEMLEFIEKIAEKTGLPVGIKAAVGKLGMWKELAEKMASTGTGPDFITIDGGEGGTGAAPPAFADNVSIPFVYAFSSVYKIFKKRDLADKILFIGSGKLGFPAAALKAMAMGVDIVSVAREAMLAIGCIQAQICHTNKCPAGVATQNKWLMAGLNPDSKYERFANYVNNFRKELLEIAHACGYEHPCQMTMEDVDISMGDNNQTQTIRQAYGYDKLPIPYESMEALGKCEHLGGLGKKA